MMEEKQKLTIYQPVIYQIKVPGRLDESWMVWAEGMTLTITNDPDSLPVSTLTGFFDQAALLGLLRRLYAMGLPLISVVWIG